MKKNLFRYLSGSILAIAISSNVNAQSLKFQKEPISAGFFKEAFDEAAAAKASSLADAAINTKALKSFNKNFKETTNASWYSSAEGGYVAKFQKDEILTRVNYDRKGTWTGTIRSYKEDKLPKDIRHQVKSVYYDYSIFYVDEVTVGDKTAYLVKIEDAGSFMTIRVVDGEMDVYESFKKG